VEAAEAAVAENAATAAEAAAEALRARLAASAGRGEGDAPRVRTDVQYASGLRP